MYPQNERARNGSDFLLGDRRSGRDRPYIPDHVQRARHGERFWWPTVRDVQLHHGEYQQRRVGTQGRARCHGRYLQTHSRTRGHT